jgi:predicted MFS family arabinose efflux permease
VTSPALGAYLSSQFGDGAVILLASFISVLDVLFILVAVPESLPERLRPASWGTPISWEKADPFASLRRIGQDYNILLLCIMVFLSYLPEAGQYSCIFIYLTKIVGFTREDVATFIAVIGVLSVLAQTVVLGILIQAIGYRKSIILGLMFQLVQLVLYGISTEYWMMWAAGSLAAMAALSYPTISALVSKNADADQQGAVQGMITGIRGLCNGLGPALYGLVFGLLHVDLTGEDTAMSSSSEETPYHTDFILPGAPFLVGAFMVFLALLVSLYIREMHSKKNGASSELMTHSTRKLLQVPHDMTGLTLESS